MDLENTVQALEWALEDLEEILDRRYPGPEIWDDLTGDPLITAYRAVGAAWEATVVAAAAARKPGPARTRPCPVDNE